MNLSETAFVTKGWNKDTKTEETRFTLRWFTPTKEVELCGHATLASSRAIFDVFSKEKSSKSSVIRFDTKFKGIISARLAQELLTIDFPLNESQPMDKTQSWIEAIVRFTIGLKLNQEVVQEIEFSKVTQKLLLRLKDVSNPEETIRLVSPDFDKLMTIDTNDMVRGVIVTIRSDQVHFLSRYFTPWNGINEDPVTGAAHTVLAPYWKKQFEMMGTEVQELIGYQCSQRGGTVVCRIEGERVHLSGKTRPFLSGIIDV